MLDRKKAETGVVIERSTLGKARGYWHAFDTIARERKYLLTTVVPEFAVIRKFISEVIEKGWSQFFALSDGEVVGWCDICREEMDGLETVPPRTDWKNNNGKF